MLCQTKKTQDFENTPQGIQHSTNTLEFIGHRKDLTYSKLNGEWPDFIQRNIKLSYLCSWRKSMSEGKN